MKAFAIFLIVLCLAALGGIIYLYSVSDVAVTGLGCAVQDAADQADLFQSLRDAMAAETFTGTVYQSVFPEGEAGEYQFCTYRVRLENRTSAPAEVVEIQVSPEDGDVLMISDPRAWAPARHDLPARSRDVFSVTILTRKDMHSIRDLTVTWYQYGLPFTQTVRYTPQHRDDAHQKTSPQREVFLNPGSRCPRFFTRYV